MTNSGRGGPTIPPWRVPEDEKSSESAKRPAADGTDSKDEEKHPHRRKAPGERACGRGKVGGREEG